MSEGHFVGKMGEWVYICSSVPGVFLKGALLPPQSASLGLGTGLDMQTVSSTDLKQSQSYQDFQRWQIGLSGIEEETLAFVVIRVLPQNKDSGNCKDCGAD